MKRSRTPSPHSQLRLAAQVVAVTVASMLMVGARMMTQTYQPLDPDLVPILVGTRSNKELVQKVHQRVPARLGSTIHSAAWTETGLLVDVTVPAPRVVVLLDSRGRASVAQARGETIVYLATPPDAEPPFTVTVVQPVGVGGLLDAEAVQVASLR